MKEKNFNPYPLQSDKELMISLFNYFEQMQVMNFAQLQTWLNEMKISDFKDLWEFARSKNCGPQLALCVELIYKRIKQVEAGKLEAFCSSSQVGYYLCDKLCGQEQEQLFVIFLNTKNKIIAEKLVFQGTLNKAIVHPRDIFRWAVLYNCAGFILVHNHPSGDNTPSHQDIEISKKIKAASVMMGLEFIDHFIVTDKNYLSMREANLL
ncbi:JAB domain-containing protein [Lactobacillus sp. PV034]|uniref:JAB domain-containing protein n=1 Tax=Lactobacillus sp. PV034 TaxID=2594495 RepID=UPI0022403F43|nr:DNA repair protein RadC [Lactobacillus sp. PV034]QNQ80620.1 DNA repair protein RadC [Lactobacillus sp. PV034]